MGRRNKKTAAKLKQKQQEKEEEIEALQPDESEEENQEENDEQQEVEETKIENEEGEGEGDVEYVREDFTQKKVYKSNQLDTLIQNLKDDFYNRLHSKRLIKRQGKVPFVEHMSLINDGIVVLPENEAIHKDLKRELWFYNLTLQDTKKGIEMLLQSNVKIGRPDDYFAEMLKSDEHMRKIKAKILKQEEKIKQFEEKRLRFDNKKFRKLLI